jgi:hypothetical protein
MFPDHKTADISVHTYATGPERGMPLVGPLPPDTVVFVIGSSCVYLMLRKGHELIVGRHHLTNTQQPELDLSTFGAAEAGTSRLHAALSHQKNGWWLIDMHSSNGTWVNDQRLAPFAPYALIETTNHIFLGNLELTIILPEESYSLLVA